MFLYLHVTIQTPGCLDNLSLVGRKKKVGYIFESWETKIKIGMVALSHLKKKWPNLRN